MTLITSLRIPDGIVIAGDSLSTVIGHPELNATIPIICPKCNHEHEIVEQFPMPPIAATTFSYAQKVIPFLGKFGIGTFGASLLAGKSIYFTIRLLEQKLEQEQNDPKGVSDLAKRVGNEIHSLLIKQLELEGKSIEELPPGVTSLGFQAVGYDGTEPKTIETYIGQKVEHKEQTQPGCTISGSLEIANAIWGLYKNEPDKPPFPVFSLQDAIDYAEFIIQTTIDHQRFSQTTPNVGGDIDIALVTPFDGFRWIRQKQIGKLLEAQ